MVGSKLGPSCLTPSILLSGQDAPFSKKLGPSCLTPSILLSGQDAPFSKSVFVQVLWLISSVQLDPVGQSVPFFNDSGIDVLHHVMGHIT